MLRPAILVTVAFGVAVAAVAAQQQPRQPARDTPAQQQDAPPAPSGQISGRVLAADNNRPVKRARVLLTGAGLGPGRGVLTDDNGAFALTTLPAGRYTLTVSKAGFVSLSYGQRRPLQAGTPLQLNDGQQLKDVNFALPRGSVLSGHIVDEDGEAAPGIAVQVLRYQYQQGTRALVPAGNGSTDDRGQFRVWGLMPGDYYVSAQARGGPGGGFGPGGLAGFPGGGRGGPAAGGRGGPPGNAGQTVADDDQRAYAPTFFPGVTDIESARAVTLGLSQEITTVDFSLQLVHVSRVAGSVSMPDGDSATGGTVALVTESVGRGALGRTMGGRIGGDGSFAIANVPPGQYTLTARGQKGRQGGVGFGSQPLTVGDSDLTSLAILLSPPASISGTISFPATQAQAPDPAQVRIAAPLPMNTPTAGAGQQAIARVNKDGTFTIDNLDPGPHLIRPNGNLRGWSLKSVLLNGQDVTDSPIEVKGGQQITGMTITFIDRQTEINGTVTNEQGQAVPDFTVLAFSTDESYWQPQSRHIATTRPDQTGAFTLRGLPAGSYYVTTVDPAEQGEWFDSTYLDQHRPGAASVTLADGDTKTQDFKVNTQN